MAMKQLSVLIKTIAFAFFEGCCQIADRIYPDGCGMLSELERSRMLAGTLAVIEQKRDHPCSRCAGHGALIVSAGTDAVACPVCHGFGVDPEWLLEARG
jgi:hypothetical protein